uniref:Uncharacterized protein n=1 Tax=viral metagenome TaxID=1070528 RepID=A0A6M3LEE5_9ZZZZ
MKYILIVLLILLAGCAPIAEAQPTVTVTSPPVTVVPPPIVVTLPPVIVASPPETVNNTLEVPVYIVVEKVVSYKLLDFWNDVEDLRDFVYFEDATDSITFSFIGKETNLSLMYASRLRLNAEKSGKYLALQYEDGYFYCSAIVNGEELWFIDPQTDKVWWVADIK